MQRSEQTPRSRKLPAGNGRKTSSSTRTALSVCTTILKTASWSVNAPEARISPTRQAVLPETIIPIRIRIISVPGDLTAAAAMKKSSSGPMTWMRTIWRQLLDSRAGPHPLLCLRRSMAIRSVQSGIMYSKTIPDCVQ